MVAKKKSLLRALLMPRKAQRAPSPSFLFLKKKNIAKVLLTPRIP